MRLNPGELKEILEYIEMADDFIPIVEEGAKKLQNLTAPLGPIIAKFIDYRVDMMARSIERLQKKHRFTKKESITIALAMDAVLKEAFKNINTKK